MNIFVNKLCWFSWPFDLLFKKFRSKVWKNVEISSKLFWLRDLLALLYHIFTLYVTEFFDFLIYFWIKYIQNYEIFGSIWAFFLLSWPLDVLFWFFYLLTYICVKLGKLLKSPRNSENFRMYLIIFDFLELLTFFLYFFTFWPTFGSKFWNLLKCTRNSENFGYIWAFLTFLTFRTSFIFFYFLNYIQVKILKIAKTYSKFWNFWIYLSIFLLSSPFCILFEKIPTLGQNLKIYSKFRECLIYLSNFDFLDLFTFFKLLCLRTTFGSKYEKLLKSPRKSENFGYI